MLVEKPLTKQELQKLMDEDNRIAVEIVVDLDELIDGDIETLNDFADETIVGDNGYLSDITYMVVGHKSPKDQSTGSVILQVKGQVECCFDDED